MNSSDKSRQLKMLGMLLFLIGIEQVSAGGER